MGVFASPLAFAAHLGRLAKAGATAERIGLAQGARLIQQEARSAIGTYKYGWPSLTPETIKRKRFGDTPLLETGKLRDSIKIAVHRHHAEVYSDDPKAVYHEEGTRTIPPRPFLTPAARLKEHEAVEAVAHPVIRALK